MVNESDIIIVGGGLIGGVLALGLAEQTNLKITLLEAKADLPIWAADQAEDRVIALSLSSKRILSRLGLWPSIAKQRVSPFDKMQVWDEKTGASISFASENVGEAVLGYIVENNLIQQTVLQAVQSKPNILYHAPVTLKALTTHSEKVVIETEQGAYCAKLGVGADGANSWVALKAGLHMPAHSYAALGLVATVTTEKPHDNTARQIFLATGPLAFLPLQDAHRSSIVWSLPVDEANRLVKLEDAAFLAELTRAFENRLGAVTHVNQRLVFPLAHHEVARYIDQRIALLGDAAHTMHPLAGQGANLGLLDAASLIDVLKKALESKRDIGTQAVLRQYERWRKADNMLLLTGVDQLKQLFASQTPLVASFRRYGLNFIDRTAILKNVFNRYAVGDRSDLPTLASFKQ